MELLRLVTFLLIALLPTLACDAVPEPVTIQSQTDRNISRLPVSPPARATSVTLFEYVTERARQLARVEYSPLDTDLPRVLTDLDYEQYRSIRFRPDAALWRHEGSFEVQLFHLGYLYQESVRLHMVEDEQIVALPFDTNLFSYEGTAAEVANLVAPQLGYAGFRIHYPLNDDTIKDEVVVFLGASYFRLLGRDHVYGLSSRALAVDIAMDRGEEFPVFREFWLVRPQVTATTITFYGLLDSPSLAGAYRFNLVPGSSTELTVEARLFARRDIEKMGLAPMSSMFLFDQSNRPRSDDFRSEVHDSDGLLVLGEDGQWIWRPLNNGPGVQVTTVYDGRPRGFGLVQRNRNFENYLDLEANYHRRPSEWVVLEDGDWGRGRVELLTFHTVSEFNDNIAAYWVPAQKFMMGDERLYRYRLIMFDGRLNSQTLAQVERTRVGWDALPGQVDAPPRSQRRFVVDFEGDDVRLREPDPQLEVILESSTGETSDLTLEKLPEIRGWRVTFRLVPAGLSPSTLRLHLELAGQRVSETWTYTWHPEDVE